MKRTSFSIICVSIILLLLCACKSSTVYVDMNKLTNYSEQQFSQITSLLNLDFENVKKYVQTDTATFSERISPTSNGSSQRYTFEKADICGYEGKSEIKFIDSVCQEISFVIDATNDTTIYDSILDSLVSSLGEPNCKLFNTADEVFATIWDMDKYLICFEDYYNPPPGNLNNEYYLRIRLLPNTLDITSKEQCECGEKIVFYTSYIIDDYEKIGICYFVSDDSHYHAEKIKYAYCDECHANYLSPVPYSEVEFCSLTMKETDHPLFCD